MKKLNDTDKRYMKMLVNEIQDFLNAINNELNQDNSYTSYLKEKIDNLYHYSNCINSHINNIINKEE